jgi:hypothetical protein
MASDLKAELLWAHQANIDRYSKILRTPLTAEERRFVKRRLAEEQAELQQLAGSVATVGKSADAA